SMPLQTALLKFPHPDRAYMHSPILDFASQPLATSHSAASSSGSASSGGMPPSPSAVAATPSSVRSISVGSFPVNNSADARVPADSKHVWVEDTQPTSTYQVVHVLAFSSARKCMSVLVRCVEAHEVAARSSATGRSATPSPSALPEFVETQGQLLLLTKGADEVMLPKLAPSASPEAGAALSHVKADLLHFAEAGLRTLLVASRVVPEAEYDAWRIMAHEASVAVEHRAELLEAAYARLERNLTPLGCTAIEDRLQAGVPEAIQTLRAAGVQVWMLTGDKAETATQIARAANLIPTAAASQLLPPYTTVQRGGDAGGYATDDDAVAPSCDMIGFDVGFEPAGVSTFLRNELPVRRGSDVSVGPTPSLYEFRIVATTERECASIIAAVQGQVNAAKRGTHSRSVAHGAASAADVTAPLPLLGALRADHSGRSDSDASLDGDAVSASSMERAVARPRKVEDVATPSLSVRSRRMEGAATPLVSTLSFSASPLRGTVEGGNVTDVAIDVDRDVHITLVVEGIETLHHCLSAGLSSHFLRLATSCHTVLACRATPLQKAALAALVKQAGRRVLTIGDGGNDVPMIQEACVGVGVAGREGSAAVRAADFTLPSFAKLPHLLMVHGRQAHYRTALTAQYTFYKSMCVCGVQLGFNFMCHFSGCSLLDTFSLTTYNLLFTFLPGFMLVLDQHRSTYELLVVPEFYKESRAMSWFDCRTFLRWVLLAIFHTTVVVGGGLLLLSSASGLHGETLDQTSLS
ncbi:HAD family hydrolase, partial [archaeon]